MDETKTYETRKWRLIYHALTTDFDLQDEQLRKSMEWGIQGQAQSEIERANPGSEITYLKVERIDETTDHSIEAFISDEEKERYLVATIAYALSEKGGE